MVVEVKEAKTPWSESDCLVHGVRVEISILIMEKDQPKTSLLLWDQIGLELDEIANRLTQFHLPKDEQEAREKCELQEKITKISSEVDDFDVDEEFKIPVLNKIFEINKLVCLHCDL